MGTRGGGRLRILTDEMQGAVLERRTPTLVGTSG